MKKHYTISITLIFMAFLISPLNSSPTGDEGITTDKYQVTFNFIHKVGGETVEFDTIRYHNSFGNNYSVTTLKYFVSDITLYKPGGETVLFDEEHYVDATDISTTSFTPANEVFEGTYTGISFVFGLDTDKNVSWRFLNPPENRMEWPIGMGGGYHYMKLEGKYKSDGLTDSFQAHSGQLDGIPYFINVDVPGSSFTVDGQNIVVQIVMDINKWWELPNTLDLNNITSIMGNSAIQKQLMENGTDIFSIGKIQ